METTVELDEEFPDDHVWDPYLRNCPCRGVLDLIANKWTALVIGALAERPYRFGELRRKVEGISQKVLTQNLRNLERDGLITRTVYPTTPPSVEYGLTELGAGLGPHLVALDNWSRDNFPSVRRSRLAFDERANAPLAPVNL
ncbi:MAG TPA: helix-turn-helix domain-containing protein [Pseudonocardiaceae bacterium]|jgi:DNA-binding HxlR family transcriptional regulator|nr:helix-turn-helix domain-containing protein [Pseudonocardiaceae bacterium]